MAEPVLLIVANLEHRQLASEALVRRALVPETPDLSTVLLADYDLAVLDAEALAGGALQTMRDQSPHAVAVVIAPRSQIESLAPSLPTGSAVVGEESLAALFSATLDAVVEARDLRSEVARWRDTHSLTMAADPAQLPSAIVECAVRLLRADAAILFVRGETGSLVPGVTARPTAARSIPPQALGTTQRSPIERVRVPTDALRRRSERLVRSESLAPVVDALPDGWLIGRALGGINRPHGVLWALRGSSHRPFDERDTATLGALVEHAALALNHFRLVGDLEGRLAGLQTSRQAMEDDKRAAQVGRIAVEAMRNLQAPLAYMRTNLRGIAATEEVHPAGVAARHLQYAFDGLARAETVAADLSRVSEGRERVPVELTQLVDAALTLAHPLSVLPNVEFTTNAVIYGHASRLADAIAELLRNASEALGVTRIDVRCSHQDGEVAIEVVDDGEGIPSDLLPRIREPFFSTRGRAGLGFTSACEVLEAAGGSVQVWSRPGIGTTVIATLPSQEVEDDLAIEALDGDTSEVERTDLESPLEVLHSRKWMDDEEDDSVADGLDFSDVGELAAAEE